MTQPTLGNILSQTQQEEHQNTRDAALRKATAQSQEELENFRRVDAFFEEARKFFTEGIVNRVPVKQLCLTVGTERPGKSSYAGVYSALALYESYDPPRITQPKHKFHSLWAEFLAWANSNGLQPKWVYCHDGGGMHSWFELKVEPLATLKAAVFVNPNDVRRQHAYCLHVLHSTSLGLLKAADALAALQGHPVANDALTKLEPLLVSTRKVVSDLEA